MLIIARDRPEAKATLIESKVLLMADGSCELYNFMSSRGSLSGKGTWSLWHDVPQGDGSAVKNVLRIQTRVNDSPVTFSLNLSSGHIGLTIWRHWGDGDDGQYIDYVR